MPENSSIHGDIYEILRSQVRATLTEAEKSLVEVIDQ